MSPGKRSGILSVVGQLGCWQMVWQIPIIVVAQSDTDATLLPSPEIEKQVVPTSALVSKGIHDSCWNGRSPSPQDNLSLQLAPVQLEVSILVDRSWSQR